MSGFLLSQILIGIAFLFDLSSFQFQKRELTLICFFCAASLISTHFFLLGATTAGAVVAVSAARFLVSIFSTDYRLKFFFIGIVLILGFITFDGYEDILIIAAMVLATYSAFSAAGKQLRLFMMSATSIVIVHNVIIFTPAGILLETFFLGSNLVSYWRFYLRKRIVTK